MTQTWEWTDGPLTCYHVIGLLLWSLGLFVGGCRHGDQMMRQEAVAKGLANYRCDPKERRHQFVWGAIAREQTKSEWELYQEEQAVKRSQ